jgi:uncharacterized protein (DUF58 family)
MTGRGEAGSPRAPAVATLGAAFVLAGLGFDLVGALACGIALLSLALGAVVWVELASRGGRLERDPGPRRVQEGAPYPVRIRLRRTLLSPPGGELVDPLLEGPVPVGPRWRRTLAQEAWLTGPGQRELEPTRLIIRDPLGLWRRALVSDAGGRIIVLPRIDTVRWSGNGARPLGRSAGPSSGSDTSSRPSDMAQFEVDGLRPYREGSPASRIHWPAVARTGEMIERSLVAGGEPRPLVVFDPRGGSDRSARERAMRAAASLCVELARSGGCELLLPGERRPLSIDPALRAWPEAHVRIAISSPRAAPSISPGMAATALVWVTAGASPPSSLARSRPGSFLVTAAHSERTAVFRVSDCFGYPFPRAAEWAPSIARRSAA